jgi:hypothetical protein
MTDSDAGGMRRPEKGPRMPDTPSPMDTMVRLQRRALRNVADAYRDLLPGGRRAAGRSEELVGQITGVLGAVRELVATSSEPAADFLRNQRALAETMTNLAIAQRQTADLLEMMATNHSAAVSALETLLAGVSWLAQS